MADVVRTCANCGNMQGSGDFCEKCGTRMPAAPAPGAAAAYSAAQAPGPSAPPPPYASSAPYGTAPQAAPPYGYPAGGERYQTRSDPLFSFAGSLRRSTLKLLWWIILGLIGLYVLFNIILVAMAGNRFTVIAFFISLFTAAIFFVLSWVVFEGLGVGMRLRDKE